MAASGELERLRIEAYTDPDYEGSAIGRFEAYVNPAELTFSYDVEYESSQAPGTTNSRMEFKRFKPGDLSLTFFLDGTGANGRPLDVQQKIAQFRTVTGYNGDIHRPNYLKVAWGTLEVRRCVLKSASVSYKMFTANGVPLRASIAATFSDNSSDRARLAGAQDQSADLTHVRVIKAGDTLPGLCFQIYGDPGLYPQIAAVNRLDDFRDLEPGARLFFPPLEK